VNRGNVRIIHRRGLLILWKKDHEEEESPGPKPEVLRIEGMNWKEAVKKAFQKEKPASGWPPKPKKKRNK